MDADVLEVDSFLEHHGIRGMHWGVRRGKKARNPGTKGPVLPSGRRARKFDTNQLSNKELKKVIDRMEMERKYADLNAKTKNDGRLISKKILLGIVGTAATAGLKKLAEHYVTQMVNKAKVTPKPS